MPGEWAATALLTSEGWLAIWTVALPCILLMILANLRVIRRAKQQPPDTYKRIGPSAARRRYYEQRRGMQRSETRF